MNSGVVAAMQRDMNIFPYYGEPQELYAGRLVYSGLSHWIRYSILDEVTSSFDCKSKIYILQRNLKTLKNMIESIPQCSKYVYGISDTPNPLDEIVKNIREKMIVAGELIAIDNGHNFGLPSYRSQNCIEGYARILGLSENREKAEFVGVTRLKSDPASANNGILLDRINVERYMNWIYGNAIWNECSNMTEFEFFNSLSKKAPYQSWTNIANKNVFRHLGRLTLYNGMHEYYIMKYENEKWMSSPLSPILSENKEERRILLGLRKENNNCINGTFEDKKSVMVLNLYCGLPLREQRIMDTFCWPLKTIDDKYGYVIPRCVWNEIKIMLQDDLGINLKEK